MRYFFQKICNGLLLFKVFLLIAKVKDQRSELLKITGMYLFVTFFKALHLMICCSECVKCSTLLLFKVQECHKSRKWGENTWF